VAQTCLDQRAERGPLSAGNRPCLLGEGVGITVIGYYAASIPGVKVLAYVIAGVFITASVIAGIRAWRLERADLVDRAASAQTDVSSAK
jgi:membrane-associated protein